MTRAIRNQKRRFPLGIVYVMARCIRGMVYQINVAFSDIEMARRANVAARLRQARRELATYIKAHA